METAIPGSCRVVVVIILHRVQAVNDYGMLRYKTPTNFTRHNRMPLPIRGHSFPKIIRPPFLNYNLRIPV